MEVEVAYALPHEQTLLEIEVSEGATCRDALLYSGLLEKYDLSLEDLKIGIFSDQVGLDHVLQEKDRVEIYRPLTIDPTEARRLRAEKKRKEQSLHKFGA